MKIKKLQEVLRHLQYYKLETTLSRETNLSCDWLRSKDISAISGTERLLSDSQFECAPCLAAPRCPLYDGDGNRAPSPRCGIANQTGDRNFPLPLCRYAARTPSMETTLLHHPVGWGSRQGSEISPTRTLSTIRRAVSTLHCCRRHLQSKHIRLLAPPPLALPPTTVQLHCGHRRLQFKLLPPHVSTFFYINI
ncbi:hypothetical protein BC827DRAFT_849821 [Russula dissimulans]|nr:hypothetical protein BC827DRAFT_849821 [Russula dissimulans]